MPVRCLASLSLFLLFLSVFPAEGGIVPAGSVKIAQGTVVVRRGAQETAGKEGMHLHSGDVLLTGADGRLGVILQDGTRISLGPNTELRIDEFLFEPGEGRFAMVLRLVHGAMVYLSGKLAELSPGTVRVETPVAVVGLRGTSFAVTLDGS